MGQISIPEGLRPDDGCGQGYVEAEGGRAGRWILDADRYFGPDCELARIARRGEAAIDEALAGAAGCSLRGFLERIDESGPSKGKSAAYIFFPEDMPLLIHAMEYRPNRSVYACASYSPDELPSDGRDVPRLGALVVFDIRAFLALPDDDGLLREAQRCLRGVDPAYTWACLAAPPDAQWIEDHASADTGKYFRLFDESVMRADWHWEASRYGSILKALADDYLQADRQWLYASPESFAWWPGPHRVDVIVHPRAAVGPSGSVLVTATMRLPYAEATDEERLARAVAELNLSGSGVYCVSVDVAERTFYFMAASRIGLFGNPGGLADLAKRILIMAREAHDLERQARRLAGTRDLDEALFYKGSRLDRDDSLRFLEKVCLPTEKSRVPWFDDRDMETLKRLFSSNGFSLVGPDYGDGFVMLHEEAPRLELRIEALGKSACGSGLELRLLYGPARDRLSVTREASVINSDMADISHGLAIHGAWVPSLAGEGYRLAYRCFLPTALYRRGALLEEAKSLFSWLGYWTTYRGFLAAPGSPEVGGMRPPT